MGVISTATTLATTLANLVLATPQEDLGYQAQDRPLKSGEPLTPKQGFLFDFEGEQAISLQTDITDHYIEDNTVVNDQAALKPIVISTEGFIGELNNVTPDDLRTLEKVAQKLSIVTAYTPELTIASQIALNKAKFAYALAQLVKDAATSKWGTTNAGTDRAVINSNGISIPGKNQTKQQVAFQKFFGYWNSRTLFTVQTPWAIFQNMIIQNLRVIQDPDTRMMSTFEITFKMIRFASDVTLAKPLYDQQGRRAFQSSQVTELGTSIPPESITLRSQLSKFNPGAV